MKRCVASFALAMALAVFAGCASTATGGLEVALKEGGGQPSVRIDDSFFRQHVDVEEAIARRTASGFLEARVRVRNRLGKDFPVQYKFEWFAEDGMEIQPDCRPWEQTVLHGGEAVSLAATAPERDAVRFVTRLRRVR